MRGKSMIGWSCALLLISALALGSYALYVSFVPFLNGGAVYYSYNEQWPDGLAKEIAKGGLTPSDAELLASYAWRTQQSMGIHKGWEAGIWMLQEQFPVIHHTPTSAAPALIVTDVRHNVVAAYPPLVADFFPQFVPGDQEDEAQLCGVADMHAAPEYYPIIQSDGKRVGTLAMVRSPNHAMAYVPENFRGWNFSAPRVVVVIALIQLALAALLLPIWVGLDAAWRGMRPFAWGLLVAVTSVIGLFAYLIARLPPPKPCPNCGEPVLTKYRRCPRCGLSLPSRCPVCRTRLKPGWQYCPRCAGVPAPPDEPPQSAPSSPPPPTPLPSADEPSLTVSVADAGSGSPVADARISLNGPSVVDGVTNAEGSFHARRIRAGDYALSVSKPGYQPARAEASVLAGPPSALRLALEALPASVAGHVTDSAGGYSVVGARVCLDTSRTDKSTVTDEAGCYSLGDIPPGPYVILAEADGFSAQSRLVELPPGREVNVSFTLSLAASQVDGEQELRDE